MITGLSADMLAAFLVFCRVGSCFMVLPGMSSARVPPQVRLLTALAVSVAVSAFVAPKMQLLLANPSGLVLMRLIISETLIGAFFGLMARFYVLALEFIISGIGMSIGFGGMLGANIEG
ncbi:MAG: flagellar biosynthetic protein FliR, partial [Oricola sp.]